MAGDGGRQRPIKRGREYSEEYDPEKLDLNLNTKRPSKKLKNAEHAQLTRASHIDESCPLWPLGECLKGNRCDYAHPANQDPDLQPMFDFRISTDPHSGACFRCAAKGISVWLSQ